VKGKKRWGILADSEKDSPSSGKNFVQKEERQPRPNWNGNIPEHLMNGASGSSGLCATKNLPCLSDQGNRKHGESEGRRIKIRRQRRPKAGGNQCRDRGLSSIFARESPASTEVNLEPTREQGRPFRETEGSAKNRKQDTLGDILPIVCGRVASFLEEHGGVKRSSQRGTVMHPSPKGSRNTENGSVPG